MDSRLFYIVFRKSLASAHWDKHGENEYVLVGDGITIDPARLQELAERTFTTPILCFPKSRSETVEISLGDAAAYLSANLAPKQSVTVSDPDAKVFLQLHPIGVARTSRSQANNSFKPKPLRGSA